LGQFISPPFILTDLQQIAHHESPRTTKLYNRTGGAISLDGLERIFIWRGTAANLLFRTSCHRGRSKVAAFEA
jgi:hypothetical protein